MSETNWVALGSVAGVVTAVFTAAMAIAVIVTAVYARGTLQAAKEDGRARTRPALAAYLERELLSHGAVLLVVKNFGPSVATDVQVSFEPPSPPASELAEMPNSEMMKWLYQRFVDPVPAWAPGWSTSNVVRSSGEALEPFTVVLSYVGPDGTRYEERFAQHPDAVVKETSSTPMKTDDPVKLGQQGVGALQALVRTIRTR